MTRHYLLIILGVIAFGIICYYSGKISERTNLDKLMMDNQDYCLRLIKVQDELVNFHIRIDHGYKPGISYWGSGK